MASDVVLVGAVVLQLGATDLTDVHLVGLRMNVSLVSLQAAFTVRPEVTLGTL